MQMYGNMKGIELQIWVVITKLSLSNSCAIGLLKLDVAVAAQIALQTTIAAATPFSLSFLIAFPLSKQGMYSKPAVTLQNPHSYPIKLASLPGSDCCNSSSFCFFSSDVVDRLQSVWSLEKAERGRSEDEDESGGGSRVVPPGSGDHRKSFPSSSSLIFDISCLRETLESSLSISMNTSPWAVGLSVDSSGESSVGSRKLSGCGSGGSSEIGSAFRMEAREGLVSQSSRWSENVGTAKASSGVSSLEPSGSRSGSWKASVTGPPAGREMKNRNQDYMSGRDHHPPRMGGRRGQISRGRKKRRRNGAGAEEDRATGEEARAAGNPQPQRVYCGIDGGRVKRMRGRKTMSPALFGFTNGVIMLLNVVCILINSVWCNTIRIIEDANIEDLKAHESSSYYNDEMYEDEDYNLTDDNE
ncbi:hypothetical protein M5K25_023158 [Dendrobium thyrsiflorum]|uniref:Uncharacterized protein n=1 Tax=Dendrobium thyrsiflorum TaxID=117978 RepID=A0ABD0UER7_DENTH